MGNTSVTAGALTLLLLAGPPLAKPEPGARPTKGKWSPRSSARGDARRRGGERHRNSLPVHGGSPHHPGTPADWCSHLSGGPRGQRDFRIDLSAAHATTREFGISSPFAISDAALTTALAGDRPLDKSRLGDVLRSYAGLLDDVCESDAGADVLGHFQVRKIGPVAVILPGIGQPVLPPGTEVVVIDTRGLPAVDGLEAALQRAVAPALTTPLPRPAQWVRGHDGAVDESDPANIYSTFVTVQEDGPLSGSGSRALPLIVLTGDRMAPRAAAFAGALRMAGRASILGADVFSEVAEADWRGVDRGGLAIRTRFLDALFRPVPPEHLPAETITQDDPSDPTTSTYRHEFDVPDGTRLIDVATHGPSGVDLDLYLLHDDDGDGVFTFPDEVVAYSAGPTADEHVQLTGKSNPSGRYQVWAHGFDVPAGSASFDLTVDVAVGRSWPDVIPADARLLRDDPVSIAVEALRLARSAPAPVTGPVARSFPEPVFPPENFPPVVTGRAETRAALLIAHGVTRLFFPYFDVVGDHIDDRLLETLRSVDDWDGIDRTGPESLLRRFGQVLHDGHQFVLDGGPDPFAYLPVFVEEIGGRPVVRRSGVPEIRPGDTILAMDGRPIEEIYAEQYRLTSAATHGYLFDKASRFVFRLAQAVRLDLADPAGATRQVRVAPQPSWLTAVLPGVSPRPSGPLPDLGAPDLYYLNMDQSTSVTTQDVVAAIADAGQRGATGMVLDMRGYPGANNYEIAERLIPELFLSPQFWIPYRGGPDADVEYQMSQYSLSPLGNPAWSGPIVLLTGPHAVSAAENFSQMLVGAHRLSAIVGRDRSAGTNGNTTWLVLPGGFYFSFTGMRVLNPDGTRFHGIGIVPDVRTSLSARDLRNGVDRDLLAAIELLRRR